MSEPRDLRSGEALLAFDSDLRVVAWNAAAAALTGIRPEEAIGRYCWELLGAHDESGALICHAGCSYARLAREGWPVPTRNLSIRAEAGRKWVNVSTVSVLDGGRPIVLNLMRNGAA